MATKRKRRPLRRHGADTERNRERLRTGHDWDWLNPDDAPATDDELRSLWAAIRDDVMSEWLDENPGTRPFAWWQFDHPDAAPLRFEYRYQQTPLVYPPSGGAALPEEEYLSRLGFPDE